MTNRIVKGVFIWALLATAFISVSCNAGSDADQAKRAADSPSIGAADIDTATALTQPRLAITKANKDSLIIATVAAGNLPDSIALQVDHNFQSIHVEVKGVNTDSLVATLSIGGDQRNLRINQIVMPDGSMDGPFGHDIHYGTTQKGDYTLIIGKDNMADGQVEGPVSVYLKLF